jgi:hypothetical protein
VIRLARIASPAIALAAIAIAACGAPAEEHARDPRASPADPAPEASSSVPAVASSAATPAPPPVDAAAILAATASDCRTEGGAQMFASPEAPDATRPLRVLAVVPGSPARAPTGLVARAPDGSTRVLTSVARHGPPSSAGATISSPAAGTWRLVAHRDGEVVACRDQEVFHERARVDKIERSQGAWRATRAWSAAEEDLFSAWVEALFDAPNDADLSHASMHAFTQDPARNALHDHLGLGEDEPPPRGLRLDPDCADLPYFLRAYFAWKRQLPFGFSRCTRGGQGRPPKCLERNGHTDMGDLEEPPRERVKRMEAFLRRRLKDTVHSGTGRTEATSDETDYYSIDLRDAALRPGAIYADPYGHILVVAKRVPPSGGNAGILFAVDGQPDGTVARKRFWRGNFLFAEGDPAFGSPGFKRFRPVTLRGGEVRGVKNEVLAASPDWGDFGTGQDDGDVQQFYDRMDEIISPDPLDPERALLGAVDALDEQLRARVRSVDNGEARFARDRSEIEMPKGAAIFETTGDWEDFSTPARDLRILVAIDVVRGFPREVARRPARFLLGGTTPDAAQKALEARLAKELAARSVTYTRSDGQPQRLTLAAVVSRSAALEMAYNPNDCPEVRWGAAEGSDEIASCRRRASRGQRAMMERHRAWFTQRERPPRP